MSICIISDHIIMPKTKFHYNTQHIDQVKPKYEGGGGGGASAPKAPPPPGSAPGSNTCSEGGVTYSSEQWLFSSEC